LYTRTVTRAFIIGRRRPNFRRLVVVVAAAAVDFAHIPTPSPPPPTNLSFTVAKGVTEVRKNSKESFPPRRSIGRGVARRHFLGFGSFE